MTKALCDLQSAFLLSRASLIGRPTASYDWTEITVKLLCCKFVIHRTNKVRFIRNIIKQPALKIRAESQINSSGHSCFKPKTGHRTRIHAGICDYLGEVTVEIVNCFYILDPIKRTDSCIQIWNTGWTLSFFSFNEHLPITRCISLLIDLCHCQCQGKFHRLRRTWLQEIYHARNCHKQDSEKNP